MGIMAVTPDPCPPGGGCGVTGPGHAVIRPACQNHGFTPSLRAESSDLATLSSGHNEQYVGNDMGV